MKWWLLSRGQRSWCEGVKHKCFLESKRARKQARKQVQLLSSILSVYRVCTNLVTLCTSKFCSEALKVVPLGGFCCIVKRLNKPIWLRWLFHQLVLCFISFFFSLRTPGFVSSLAKSIFRIQRKIKGDDTMTPFLIPWHPAPATFDTR